ncbi:MAG TPA: EF-hand domain-containing protein [Vicinamibacterales bacterium]|nr:EF-hand domain-containing protein [Vicinamibacterales bacterium]
MLSDLQRRKLATLFKLHDLDHDGILTRTDFEQYADRLAGARGFRSGTAEHSTLLASFITMWDGLGSKADTNRDKQVTLDEWLAYYDTLVHQPAMYEQVGAPIAKSVFGLLDANGDGVVTPDDYALLFGAGSADPQQAAAAFKRIDIDADGRVTPAELSRLLGEFFTSQNPEAPGNWLFGAF